MTYCTICQTDDYELGL